MVPVYNTLKDISIFDPAPCDKGASLLLAFKDRLSFTQDVISQTTVQTWEAILSGASMLCDMERKGGEEYTWSSLFSV